MRASSVSIAASSSARPTIAGAAASWAPGGARRRPQASQKRASARLWRPQCGQAAALFTLLCTAPRAAPAIVARAASRERFGPQLADLDHHVRRQAGAPRRVADRLGARRLVQAVGLAPVRRQEREQPIDAARVVDLLDQRGALGVELQFVGELAFDQKQCHRSLLARRGYLATRPDAVF